MTRVYDGINIQFPISTLILSGEKVIETRTYKIPEKYLNKEIAMIETPGKQGKFKSRVVAIIKFTECFKYKNQTEFYKDSKRHLVDKESPWAWKNKAKWGWKVEVVKLLKEPTICKSRGITFRSNIEV